MLEVSKDPEELELFRSECTEVAKVVEGTSDLQPVRDRQFATFNIFYTKQPTVQLTLA